MATRWVLNRGLSFLSTSWFPDAGLFYHLEAWIGRPTDPSTTVYLSQIEVFQRHITTAAYKLAGGIDLSSSSLTKPIKQNSIATAFVTKITKAFIDTLYAFLDGLMTLASDEAPIVTGKRAPTSSASTNPLELLDISNGVRSFLHYHKTAKMFQDVRLLLVFSNFGYFSNVVVPSMISQLESAFGISISEEKQVSLRLMTIFKPYFVCRRAWWKSLKV